MSILAIKPYCDFHIFVYIKPNKFWKEMEHLKLFENFSPKYLWPEAKFWLNNLEPEELCFLGVYSYMLEMDKKQPLFEVVYQGTSKTEPDEEGDGSFEMIFDFPVSVEKDESYPYLTCNVNFRGGFSKYYPGTHNDPPEGGEYQLQSVEIEFAYYLDKNEVNDYDLDNMEYKSEFITKANMINLLEYIASFFISNDDDNTNSTTPEIPQGLKDKCENIRNKDQDLKKGYGMFSRFKNGN
jgi:hypothetical protein